MCGRVRLSSDFSHVKIAIVVVCLVMVALMGSAIAEDQLEQQRAALTVIRATADGICGTVPLSGSVDEAALSGAIEAKLPELFKRILSIGGDISANLQNTKYEGVVQTDLTKVIKQAVDCKRDVFHTLLHGIMMKVYVNDAKICPPNYLIISGANISGYRVGINAPKDAHLCVVDTNIQGNIGVQLY